MRCNEPGWQAMAIPDGRRGIWIRMSDDTKTLEICGGREGDDHYVKLDIGEAISEKLLYETTELLTSFSWAYDISTGEQMLLSKGHKGIIANYLRNIAGYIDDGEIDMLKESRDERERKHTKKG